MKVGFVFPGQGAQYVGMGKDIYDEYETARKIYERVEKLTDIDVAKLTFDGPEDSLNQTEYTQISILTMTLAILEVLKQKHVNAEVTSGLSLGEYSSLIYGGALSFEDGVRIVKKRGEFMQKMVPAGEWSMAAILGIDNKKLEEVCRNVKSGFVTPANYNCVGQIAISGEKLAVEEAMKLSKEAGALKTIQLKTFGPFHTEKLEEAANELGKELEKIEVHPFRKIVVKNIDGQIYGNSDDVKKILKKHIISPVRFSESINTMLDLGVDTFIEIGPGKTLSGFIKRASKSVDIYNVNDLKTLKETVERFGGKDI